MIDLADVGLPELEALASALETERLVSAVGAVGSAGRALARLSALELNSRQAGALLRAVAAERRRTQRERDRVELVWTGPDVEEGGSRDTAVVVRDLFARARRSVLISTFAIDRGERAEALFGGLARRMDEEDGLSVRLFVNIHRDKRQESESVLVREFRDRFRDDIWPGRRLPKVYYDPRALAPAGGPRACLHAKCVVIDDERAFVSSANFTEAAQARNIEAGVLVDQPAFARQLREQFDALVAAGEVVTIGG